MQAQRVVFSSRSEVSLENFELREPGPQELLLEIGTSIISPGTERAFLLAQPNTATSQFGFPFYPGYSNMGRVVHMGRDVRNVQVGDVLGTMAGHQSHVVVRPPLDYPRQRGSGELLDDSEPADMSWRVPGSAAECAIFVIAAVALYGVRRAEVGLGGQVIVVGLGPIGLLAGQFARCSGAIPVIGIARTEARRRIAVAAGFDEAFETFDELFRRRANFGNAARTVVIEATGDPARVKSTLAACPEGATLILLGSTRGAVPDVDFYSMVHRKALTIVGAHQPTRPTANYLDRRWQQYWDADTALRMISSRRIDARQVISHKFDAAEVRGAYEFVCESRSSLAVALTWSANASEPIDSRSTL